MLSDQVDEDMPFRVTWKSFWAMLAGTERNSESLLGQAKVKPKETSGLQKAVGTSMEDRLKLVDEPCGWRKSECRMAGKCS
jgi:hypothetical protein